jgi:hypothetical protein
MTPVRMMTIRCPQHWHVIGGRGMGAVGVGGLPGSRICSKAINIFFSEYGNEAENAEELSQYNKTKKTITMCHFLINEIYLQIAVSSEWFLYHRTAIQQSSLSNYTIVGYKMMNSLMYFVRAFRISMHFGFFQVIHHEFQHLSALRGRVRILLHHGANFDGG